MSGPRAQCDHDAISVSALCFAYGIDIGFDAGWARYPPAGSPTDWVGAWYESPLLVIRLVHVIAADCWFRVRR
jgi:hypothetical protein